MKSKINIIYQIPAQFKAVAMAMLCLLFFKDVAADNGSADWNGFGSADSLQVLFGEMECVSKVLMEGNYLCRGIKDSLFLDERICLKLRPRCDRFFRTNGKLWIRGSKLVDRKQIEEMSDLIAENIRLEREYLLWEQRRGVIVCLMRQSGCTKSTASIVVHDSSRTISYLLDMESAIISGEGRTWTLPMNFWREFSGKYGGPEVEEIICDQDQGADF